MLGWRGASRYYSEGYREGLALECRALKHAREDIGLTNIVVMVPFCGICGQAPIDHPEFAQYLVDCGIDSISVTPDSFVAVKRAVAAAEQGTRTFAIEGVKSGTRAATSERSA